MTPQGKIHYFENIKCHEHKEFVLAQNHCILCRHVLELRHVRLDEDANIREEAYCPDCDLRTRTKTYPIN